MDTFRPNTTLPAYLRHLRSTLLIRLIASRCGKSPRLGRRAFDLSSRHFAIWRPVGTVFGRPVFLREPQTARHQTLDFYHATEYLADVSNGLFASQEIAKKWLSNRCHQLKYFEGGAVDILEEVVNLYDNALKGNAPKTIKFRTKPIEGFDCEEEDGPEAVVPLNKPEIKEETIAVVSLFKKNIDVKALDAFVSYFRNNIAKARMNYAQNLKANLPIGSGVTESACKMIIKARLCRSHASRNHRFHL